jgi:hypothetical protein
MTLSRMRKSGRIAGLSTIIGARRDRRIAIGAKAAQ